MSKRNSTLRSVGAVFGGLVFIFVLSGVMDAIMHVSGVFPPMGERMSDSLFGVAFAYRAVICILGSSLAAHLAPSKPMTHALILGGIGFVLSILGHIAMGDQGPSWFSLGLVVTAPPFAWLGGKLHERCCKH